MSVWRTGGPTGAARRAAACRSFSSAMECGAEHRISESPTDRLRRCASRLRVRRGKSRTKQSSPPAQGRLHRFGYPGRRPAARHENQCDAVARSRQPAAVGGHNNLFTDSVHCSPSSENHGPSTLSSLAQRLAMPAGWPRLDT